MWRTWFPPLAFAGSIIAGLVLAYSFLQGDISTATMLVAAFAFAAFAVTAVMLHWPADDDASDEPPPRLGS